MSVTTCGCCAGTSRTTPIALHNRPGLRELHYRVGTHASFLQTMKARLSSLQIDGIRPLLALTTRQSSDPSIALLDGWALVADILTFYQERIANEGYLRTATERRSILELARLIGYRLRPGVAASVFLAYTLEPANRVLIPAGSRSQTIPGPGELPQSFETSEDLTARDEWNLFQVRLTHPDRVTLDEAPELDDLYLKGVNTKLEQGDPLLLVFGTGTSDQIVRRIASVLPEPDQDRTRVRFVPIPQSTFSSVMAPGIDGLEEAEPPESVRVVAARFQDVARFGVSARGKAVREILRDLERLQRLSDEKLPADGPRIVKKLRARQTEAERNRRSAKLAAWLGAMVAELEEALRAGTTPAPAIARAEAEPDGVAETLSAEAATAAAASNPDPFLASLELPASIPPPNALRLSRDAAGTFGERTDAGTRLLTVLRPALAGTIYRALANVAVPLPPPEPVQVFALRVVAPLFGYNATEKRPRLIDDPRPFGDDNWHVLEPIYGGGVGDDDPDIPATALAALPAIIGEIKHEEPAVVNLDAAYDAILPADWIVVVTKKTDLTEDATLIGRVGAVQAGIGRAKYNVSGKTTRIELTTPDGATPLKWITRNPFDLTTPSSGRVLLPDDFNAIRFTTVFAQSELLDLAERPFDPVVQFVGGDSIELATFNGELEAGRRIIVSGERTDVPDVTGIFAAELTMIAGVEHGRPSPFPSTHTLTTLVLAKPLAYRYKRDTVTIHGNVAHATHGETQNEALGSGDAGQARQEMPLLQSPLTYLSAATPRGAESTLRVRLDGVLWHETETFLGAGPKDRIYITRTDDDDATTVIFGDGKAGARLPTGRENVKALYRTGIGAPGNAKASQISVLSTRPLGVKSVINPLPATGGANRENRDQARRNAPMAVMALDRLIGVRDYEDFARTFAGIGRASAALISDGRRQLVHLTIAGADDIPIAETSDLFLNLRSALRLFGDPALPLRVAVRKLNALVISAKVRLHPDFLWESVEPKIRAALLDAFGFARRELGQDALSSECLSVIQAQAGVVFADLDIFDAVPEDASRARLAALGTTLTLRHRVRALKAERVKESRRVLLIRPAELAYLSPVPDTLLLTELPR